MARKYLRNGFEIDAFSVAGRMQTVTQWVSHWPT